MQQEPAMPVHPRPADIDNYNAWAIESNRPLWHEHLAPAAAAPPLPAPEEPPVAMPPHPATIQLFGIDKTIKYKKGLVATKREAFSRYQAYLRRCLARELPELLDSAPHRALLETPWRKPIEDQTDSLLCALIAFLHLRFGGDRTEVIGNDETGHILLPRPIGGGET